jgi:hypothetical protein
MLHQELTQIATFHSYGVVSLDRLVLCIRIISRRIVYLVSLFPVLVHCAVQCSQSSNSPNMFILTYSLLVQSLRNVQNVQAVKGVLTIPQISPKRAMMSQMRWSWANLTALMMPS